MRMAAKEPTKRWLRLAPVLGICLSRWLVLLAMTLMETQH
jgi:hypothetical protein